MKALKSFVNRKKFFSQKMKGKNGRKYILNFKRKIVGNKKVFLKKEEVEIEKQKMS